MRMPFSFNMDRILKIFYLQKNTGKETAKRGHDAAQPHDGDIPINEANYIVFDTELTGLKLKKNSIVSIGAVKMDGSRINLGDFFYRIVEPKTELTGKSVVIHGITPSEASESPRIDVLLPEFLDFCGDSILVGHVVSIDLDFINKEMKRVYGSTIPNRAVDTFTIYGWIRRIEEKTCAYHGGTPGNADLFTLAEKYNIPVASAHNALNDAFVTAQLFQRFLSLLPALGVRSVHDLLKIGGGRVPHENR
jgi:DNA polymerase-3 subunit epsilon